MLLLSLECINYLKASLTLPRVVLKKRIVRITLRFIGNLQKPVNAKIDAVKPNAALDKQNARVVTPLKAELAYGAPNSFKAHNVEAAPLAKQAAFAKQEWPGLGPGLASAPPVAPKTDKAKKAKSKPVAHPLASEHLTCRFKRSNKEGPLSRLGFQSALLILELLPILFGT